MCFRPGVMTTYPVNTRVSISCPGSLSSYGPRESPSDLHVAPVGTRDPLKPQESSPKFLTLERTSVSDIRTWVSGRSRFRCSLKGRGRFGRGRTLQRCPDRGDGSGW